MTVIVLLIFASLALAATFLACFIWAVRSGQFDDTYTPSMRVLTDESSPNGIRALNPLNPLTGCPPSPPLEERAGERRPIHTQAHEGEVHGEDSFKPKRKSNFTKSQT